MVDITDDTKQSIIELVEEMTENEINQLSQYLVDNLLKKKKNPL